MGGAPKGFEKKTPPLKKNAPTPPQRGGGVLRYPAGQSNVFKRKPFQSICESRYNIPKNFPCGPIAKKKQTKNVYNLDTIAAAWLRAILS